MLSAFLAPFFTTAWLYGGLSIAGLAAIAIYAPSLRIKIIAGAVAICIGSGLYGFTKGYRDGADDVRAKWVAAEQAARDDAAKVLADGKRDAADPGLRDPNDRHFQRNNR